LILRVIRGRADRERIAALRAALIDRLGPGPHGRDGPDRYHIGTRLPAEDVAVGGQVDVLLLACWGSAEAAAEGDARGVSPLRLATRHLGQAEVAHFEIEINLLRDADVRPAAIRVATGRFLRPGGDIEMQQLLRDRLASIGPEMTEAYVGRRLVGRTVDVIFVSAWQHLPARQSLEGPFWPDISIHYDEFDVEVYGPAD
jgi:hypothetical protein